MAEGSEVGRVVELEVESVAAGGDGVAHEPEGRVVFVPGAAPGDRVRARVVEEHASFLRARIETVAGAGPGRNVPPCPYFGTCGGCRLQHLSQDAQVEAKRVIVGDALHRIGKVDVPVPPVWTAGPRMGYRNRVTLTLRRLTGGAVRAGYHALGVPDELVDVADCPLAEPAVGEAWRALRVGWGGAARRLPGGRELRITLRGSASGRTAIAVEGGDPGRPGDPGAISGMLPGLACLSWRPDGHPRRILAGDETFPERWQGLELRLGPETFLQVNRRAAEAIERSLDAGLGDVTSLRIVDLYGGVGTRAIRWAMRGAETAACDADGEAVAAGREAAARYGVRVDLRKGRVEDVLGDLLPADVTVVNPPRRGLSKQVVRALRAGGGGRLVYVSCDPATLARDLARLAEGWRVVGVKAFDAFPQTAHVETVAWMEAA